MKHNSLQTTIFFLFIFIGCTFFNNTHQVDLDYEILLKEQIEAHQDAGFNTPFQQVLGDYTTFKGQLYSELKEK